MSIGWNLPDGVTPSDLPGYNDIDCPICDEDDPDPDCELCEGTWICDSRDYKQYLKDNREPDDDYLDRDDDYNLYGRDL